MDQKKLLIDPNVNVDNDLLKQCLKDSFSAYLSLLNECSALDVSVEWRYYNDVKSWLAKAVHKKKTVFWLSIWDGYFKISMYFNEKTRIGIDSLAIDHSIKQQFLSEPIKGKFVPLIIDADSNEQIVDLVELMKYKISCK